MTAFLEGIAGIFIFGTLGFWILIGVASCFIVGLLAYERSGLATFTLLATFFLLYQFGSMRPDQWIIEHPWKSILYLILYIVTGAGWAIFKWWRMIAKLARTCEEMREKFLSDRRISDKVIPEEKMGDWETYFTYELRDLGLTFNRDGLIPPSPKNYKEKIYSWIIFWPWSVIAYVFDEPLRKIANAVYDAISGSLVRISEHAFKDIKGNFVPQPKEEVESGRRSNRRGI